MNELPIAESMKAVSQKRRPRPSDRPFFVVISTAILVVSLIGFAPSFFLRGHFELPKPGLPLTPLIAVHAIMATAWLILFIVQAYLAKARTAWHRTLGWCTASLAILYIPVSVEVVIQQAVRGSNLAGAPPLQFFAIPLFDVVVFAIFFVIAIRARNRAPWHKRFMLAASAAMVAPGAARIALPNPILAPLFGFGTPLAVLSALAVWDRYSQGKITRPTKIAFAVVIASDVIRVGLSRWPLWQEFAGYIVEMSR